MVIQASISMDSCTLAKVIESLVERMEKLIGLSEVFHICIAKAGLWPAHWIAIAIAPAKPD